MAEAKGIFNDYENTSLRRNALYRYSYGGTNAAIHTIYVRYLLNRHT